MTQPITVEQVIARLNIGGPAIISILLTRRLADLGYLSTLVTGVEGDSEGNMMDLADAQGVRPVVLPGMGRELSPVRDLSVLFALYRRFRRTRPTIVHTHTAKAGVVGRTAAAFARVPVRIHTYHGHIFHGYFSPAKTGLFIRVEKAMAKLSSRIVVLGERQKREILAFGIGREGQFEVVPLGLDLSELADVRQHSGELRAELGIAQEAPVVLIVARLVPIKNHRLFIDAAKLVLEQRPDAVFLIAGDGPERDALAQYSKQSGMDQSIRFLGFRRDLARLYAAANVSVLCSNNEGMPVALIESLAAGVPAVATDVGETREVVEDGRTGFVVPAGDAAALAGRIGWLLAHPDEAAQMGSLGHELTPQRFGIDRLVRDTDKLYRSLAKETGHLPVNG